MSDKQAIRQKLRSLFPDFDSLLLDELLQIGEIKHFAEGEYLMRPGQYFHYTMLILDGLVKLYREDDHGNEYFIYYLQPGNACALSMVCATKQETSQLLAKASRETQVLAIPIRHMDSLMTRFKPWYYFVLETYRTRFEELLVVIDSIAFHALDEKLEFYLKRQFDAQHSNTLEITHQQIALDLNTSREVVTRLLKKMSENGWIKLHRNAIERIKGKIHLS